MNPHDRARNKDMLPAWERLGLSQPTILSAEAIVLTARRAFPSCDTAHARGIVCTEADTRAFDDALATRLMTTSIPWTVDELGLFVVQKDDVLPAMCLAVYEWQHMLAAKEAACASETK